MRGLRDEVNHDDAFVWDAERRIAISREDFDLAVDALIEGVRSLGFERGDAFAILMENRIEYLVALTLAELGGFTVTPVNRHLRSDEVAYIVEQCGARAIIVSERYADVAAEVRREVPACEIELRVGDDPEPGTTSFDALVDQHWGQHPEEHGFGRFMLFSSGTTGRPKGIVREGGVSKFALAVRDLLQMDANTIQLITAPLYHAGPLMMVSSVKACDGKLVLLDRFDERQSLRTIEEYRVTHGYWVPTMFVRLLKLPVEERNAFDVSTQIAALHVGGPCPRDVKQRMFEWWGPIIHEVYGGSEGMGMTYASPHDWLAHPGTVGAPDDCEIHICDETGKELDPGEVGLVYFHSGEVKFTYYNDPAKVDSTRHPVHRNWTTYGDVGWVDEDGFLYLTDRRTDMVVTGGVNVYTQEVEDMLLQHPAVYDACVFGIPDEEYGQKVVAVIERTPGDEYTDVSLHEIRQFVHDRMAAFKCPKEIAEMMALPRLPTGKLRKHELKAHYLAERDRAGSGVLPDLAVPA